MDDSNDTTQAAAAVPAWQRRTDAADREKDEEEDEEASKTSKPLVQSEKIRIARRFLEHDDVKSASREKKVAFLRSKGINDEDVEKALGSSASAQDVRGLRSRPLVSISLLIEVSTTESRDRCRRCQPVASCPNEGPPSRCHVS